MTATTAWLQRAPSPNVAARVFCIPHAGCGTNVFANWPQQLDAVEFLPVELPGRLTRFGERIPDTFQELAAEMTSGLAGYLEVPFAFFGHCWSALAAYEATAQLDSAGSPAARLFVSSQVAPQHGPVGRMLGMDDAQLAEELAATIQDLGKRPHPELVAIHAKVLRDDIEVSRRYVTPDPPRLSCPITAIGWNDDSEVRPEHMTGWAACGDTTFTVLAGHHHRFIDAPPELLRTVCAAMPARAA